MRKRIGRRDFLRRGTGLASMAAIPGMRPHFAPLARHTAGGPQAPAAAEAYRCTFYPFTGHPDADTCWSVSVGPDGRIYAAACAESVPGGMVKLVRYNEQKDALDYLFYLGEKVDDPGNSGRATQCKIHYSFAPSMSDGVLYMATHLSGPPIDQPAYSPWHSWHDPAALLPRLRAAGLRHAHERGALVGHADPQGGLPLPACTTRSGRPALRAELPARSLHHLRHEDPQAPRRGPDRLHQRTDAVPRQDPSRLDHRRLRPPGALQTRRRTAWSARPIRCRTTARTRPAGTACSMTWRPRRTASASMRRRGSPAPRLMRIWPQRGGVAAGRGPGPSDAGTAIPPCRRACSWITAAASCSPATASSTTSPRAGGTRSTTPCRHPTRSARGSSGGWTRRR